MAASARCWKLARASTPTYRVLIGLNPMTGVVEGFRWALLRVPPNLSTIAVSAAVSVVLLVSGAFFFRRVEKTFADLL